MGFDDEAVETVIDLVDQVYTLRRQLDQLGQAIGQQPAETREAIALALKDLRERMRAPRGSVARQLSPRGRDGGVARDRRSWRDGLVRHDRHADARIDRPASWLELVGIEQFVVGADHDVVGALMRASTARQSRPSCRLATSRKE